jgi:hypothetical protein
MHQAAHHKIDKEKWTREHEIYLQLRLGIDQKVLVSGQLLDTQDLALLVRRSMIGAFVLDPRGDGELVAVERSSS